MAKYICHPKISWSVEMSGIVLIRSDTGNIWTLDYPDAAIWDLISRRYTIEKAVRVLGAIASLDPKSVQGILVDRLETWVQEGILVRSK